MKSIFFCLCCLIASILVAQHDDINSFDPDDILIAGDALPKVLLVGSFHMNYPNLDAHVTDESKQVDVNDQKRREEMRELLDYIARFQPNKIIVERHPGSNVNDRYQAYLAGDLELGKSEIYQLAFRLGKQFGVKEMIPGDAPTLVRSLAYHPDSAVLHPIIDSIYQDWDFSSDTELDARYSKLYDLEDELLAKSSLLDFFKYRNDVHRSRRGHGHYLTGDFQTPNHAGPDALAMHWYARNLRITRLILRAIESPEDRVMVLFGAGHLSILQQQLESYPGLELVNFGDL